MALTQNAPRLLYYKLQQFFRSLHGHDTMFRVTFLIRLQDAQQIAHVTPNFEFLSLKILVWFQMAPCLVAVS